MRFELWVPAAPSILLLQSTLSHKEPEGAEAARAIDPLNEPEDSFWSLASRCFLALRITLFFL